MKRQSPPLTIVGALELCLRVRVGFAVEEGNENLEECLQSLTNEEFSTELMNADCDLNDDEDEDWQVCEQLKYAKQFYISIAEICSNGLAYLSKYESRISSIAMMDLVKELDFRLVSICHWPLGTHNPLQSIFFFGQLWTPS